MLVARAVARPLQRGLASRFSVPPGARSIHLPLPRPPPPARNLLNRVHFILSKAVRGFNSYTRGVALVGQTVSRQVPRTSIGQSLSLPARVALARPVGGMPFMPRPVAVRRSMQQVGLGTARTFATTRPIFANLVENVPVAGRALLEADFDFTAAPGQRLRLVKQQKTTKKTSKSKAKPRTAAPVIIEESQEKLDAEALAQYFKAAPAASVVAYLDIPLAPTPSGRMPLAEHPLPGPPMAPLQQLAEAHATHSKHAIRVASLFRRLDAARVWEKGAAMEAFGDRTGLCTVLRVKFSGWAKKDVQAVVGEGARGWCALMEASSAPSWAEEVHQSVDADSILSSDPASPWLREERSLMEMRDCITEADLATSSFVMPTIDFAASFTSRVGSDAAFSSRASESEDSSLGFTPISGATDILEATERWSDESDQDEALSLPDSDGAESLADVWASESTHTASGVGFSSEHWRRVSTVISDF
ncbi:hypothetical protein AURDEDRAFT_113799, partial [Auricularia subglabra TFB-10046 SS5]